MADIKFQWKYNIKYKFGKWQMVSFRVISCTQMTNYIMKGKRKCMSIPGTKILADCFLTMCL